MSKRNPRKVKLERVHRDRMRPLRVVEYLDHSAVFEKSPVEIKEGYIISDRDTGEIFLTLNFRSVSEKTITAFKEILTSARLAFFASSTSSGTEYSILFDKGDLSDVNAIIFTIESEKSLGIDENCDNVTASIDDPNINYYPSLFQNEKKLRVLVYHTNGGQLNQGTLLKLRIDGGENCDIQISNIMISDGEQDYYLPKVEW